jgi:hypothetical protein
MEFLLRLFLLLTIIWFSVAGLAIPGLIFVGLYLIFYTGYELVLVVFLIDIYHEALLGWPWLTFLVLVSTIFVDLLKPRLLLYTVRNEIVS